MPAHMWLMETKSWKGRPGMRFVETGLAGAWLIDPEPARDGRGLFMRTFCEREFAMRGLCTRFVQHSVSCSREKGTLRGMHFQRAPHGEVKLVRCAKGEIFDVIIDMRPGSPTRGQWEAFELSSENLRQIYIPEGIAHGFQTLCDGVEVGYLISAFYAPEAACGVRCDDPAFGIRWPLPISAISERDMAWPHFDAN